MTTGENAYLVIALMSVVTALVGGRMVMNNMKSLWVRMTPENEEYVRFGFLLMLLAVWMGALASMFLWSSL
jgi:hypothetical protein